MDAPAPTAITQKGRGRKFVSILCYGAGLLVCGAIVFLFGLIPFLLGALAQAISPRRIPPLVIGLLATGAFFGVQYFVAQDLAPPGDLFVAWSLILLHVVIFIAFFGSGVAFFRELFPRRYRLAGTRVHTQP
jgi:hypothetical protein